MIVNMLATLSTQDEPNRLRALRALEILDTLPEQCFDDLTRLAAAICEAPVALVSLVDQDRQWVKSETGGGFRETSREVSFCAHAIHEISLFMVEDTTRDPRFADNPLVTGEQGIRFYAGMPLDSAGYKIGTLCIFDRRPRQLSELQLASLAILGRQVESLLTLRLRSRELILRGDKLQQVQRQKDELSALLVHDLRNPLASILLNAHLLELEHPSEIARDIVTGAEAMRRMVANMLDISRSQDGTLNARLGEVRVRPLFEQVCSALATRAHQSGKELSVLAPTDLVARADPELLRRICDNLVDNAVKYASPGLVHLEGRRVPGGVEVRVEDKGPGIPAADRELVFDKYTQLGSSRSGGLGLTFCRLAAKAQGGSIRVEESPLGGSAFVLTLP